MAIIKCPECSANISEYALSCPFCGCPKEVIERLINENIIRLEYEIQKKAETELRRQQEIERRKQMQKKLDADRKNKEIEAQRRSEERLNQEKQDIINYIKEETENNRYIWRRLSSYHQNTNDTVTRYVICGKHKDFECRVVEGAVKEIYKKIYIADLRSNTNNYFSKDFKLVEDEQLFDLIKMSTIKFKNGSAFDNTLAINEKGLVDKTLVFNEKDLVDKTLDGFFIWNKSSVTKRIDNYKYENVPYYYTFTKEIGMALDDTFSRMEVTRKEIKTIHIVAPEIWSEVINYVFSKKKYSKNIDDNEKRRIKHKVDAYFSHPREHVLDSDQEQNNRISYDNVNSNHNRTYSATTWEDSNIIRCSRCRKELKKSENNKKDGHYICLECSVHINTFNAFHNNGEQD